MRYPLFSEIAHSNDPVLDAYESIYLKGDINIDPLDAAITEYIKQNGGYPSSAEVQIAVRDRLIDALIAQIFNLWNYFKEASKESEQNRKYFQEKMDEVADLKAAAIRDEYPGKYRLSGPPVEDESDS